MLFYTVILHCYFTLLFYTVILHCYFTLLFYTVILHCYFTLLFYTVILHCYFTLLFHREGAGRETMPNGSKQLPSEFGMTVLELENASRTDTNGTCGEQLPWDPNNCSFLRNVHRAYTGTATTDVRYVITYLPVHINSRKQTRP